MSDLPPDALSYQVVVAEDRLSLHGDPRWLRLLEQVGLLPHEG